MDTKELNLLLAKESTIEAQLALLKTQIAGEFVFSTSFGIEDQALSYIIGQHKDWQIRTFTLDTGRLFQETYSTWQETENQFELQIKPFYPDTNAIESFISTEGINPFYNSLELRKKCCFVRKVEPLGRALKGASVWITGLRAEQSNNRQEMTLVEWDETHKVLKYNPLLHWTFDEVKTFVSKNHIPYNILHDKGFVSIGCAPCTRAIRPGEDFRAGRWWWEDTSKKECGLHIHQ